MIRRVAWLVSFALYQLSHPANADDRVDARAIIDRVIDFAGGRDALARYEKPFVRFVKATAVGGRGPEESEMTITTLFPDKYRTHQTTKKGGILELIFNGGKGWNKGTAPGGGVRTNQMKETPLRATRERLYGQWLSTLLPLDDGAFHLSTVVEQTVIDGRPAVGVNVAHEDRPDVQLYFDKETFALVKLARKMGDQVFEEYYDDYADLDGLVYPKKEVHHRNGAKTSELQTTELKFLDAVEDKVFQEP
jgi:hypothetical protein